MDVHSSHNVELDTQWKLLIIDDDEDDYLIARSMLAEARGQKIELQWAATYEAGREALFTNQYHAVLVDYDLGLHSGINLIQEANEREYAAPLILYTGRGSYDVDIEAMQAGATMYLTKGEVNPLLLERAIRYSIEMKDKEQMLQQSVALLRESEARERAKVAEMNAVLEAVPAIVWITHDRQAQVVTGNQFSYDFLRVPSGRNLSKSAHKDAPRNFRVFQNSRELAPEELPLQIAAATGRAIRNFEEDVIFEDGSQADLLGNVTPLLDEQGRPSGAVAAFIDVTQRKRAEERYTTLFNFVREGFAHYRAIYDEQGKVIDLRVEEINPVGAKLSGVPREAQIGKTWREVWPGVDEQLFTIYQQVDQTGEFVRFEDDNHLTNRIYDVVITRMAPGEFLATFTDITDHKQAETAIRESEERFRALISASAQVLYTMSSDWQEMRQLMGNHFLADTMEPTRDWMQKYIHPDDQQRVWMVIEKAIQIGAGVNLEHRVISMDGTLGWVSSRAVPVRNAQGEIIEWFGAASDITDRKKAEESVHQLNEALRQRNIELDNERARWQGVVEGIADEVWLCDLQGKMSLMNLPDKTAMGLEEFQDWPYEKVLEEVEILEPDRQPRPVEKAPLLRALQGEIVRGEEIMRQRETGKTRYRQYSAAPTRDMHGAINGAVAIVHDVTKLKATEMALRESEAVLREREAALMKSESRLRDFLENTHDSFFTLDHEFRFQYINRRFSEIVHMDPNKMLGQVIWEIFPGYLGTPVEQYYRKTMEARVPIHYEMGGIYSAAWYEVTVYPSQEGIAVFSVDRTEEKKAREEQVESEQKFRESEKRLRRLMEGNIIGINVRDVAGHILDANPAFLQMIGYTCDDLANRSIALQDLTPPAHLDFDRQAIEEATATGSCKPYEKEYVHKDGHLIPALVAYTRLDEKAERSSEERDSEGRLIGFVLDLTERRQAQQHLQEYAEKLKQSNQELEQFAFVASHDLQEPLRKIRMFGSLIQSSLKGKLDAGTLDNFERMMSASERMQAMIQDLLELSRVNTQGRPFEPVDLAQVVAEVISDLEPRILRTRGKVQVEALPMIEADPIQIHQILQNLIGNGLKFHKPETPPMIIVSAVKARSSARKGSWISIQVQDNGIGFEEQQFEKILQPFQRLHGRSEYEGTGIGLAIVKKIVDRHHGEISAQSTPGEGSTFIVTLPVKQND